MYFVLVNDSTKFSFETFDGANNMFKTLQNFPGGSNYKVCLYDCNGALINKNY